jgi:hypothetical protein
MTITAIPLNSFIKKSNSEDFSDDESTVQLIENFKFYFAAYSGDRKVPEDFRERLDGVFDKSLVVVAPSGEIGYDQFCSSLPALIEKGARISVISISSYHKGSKKDLEYVFRFTTPGYETIVRAIGIVEHGRIVRIEPQENAKHFDVICNGQSSNMPKI